MARRDTYPLAMNNMGEPAEMSPVKNVTYTGTNSPILEVTQPLESKELLEIREPSSFPGVH